MPRLTFACVALCAVLAPESTVASDESPAPARKGLIKRTFHSFMDDDSDSQKRGFHLGPFQPGIGILSSGAGPGPMLHLWAPDLGSSGVDLHASASYSIYGYQYYDAQFGWVPHEGRRLPPIDRGTSAMFPLTDLEKTASIPGFHIYASARHRDYPREDFYGRGPVFEKAGRGDYRLRDDLFEGVVRTRVARLSLMGRAGLLKPLIRGGTDSSFPDVASSHTEQTAPGLTGAPDFIHVSAAAWLELRDQPENPHSGISLGVSASRFDDRHSNLYQFSRVIVDAREYVPLFSHRHILALRQVGYFDKPNPGSHVPFYLQPSFGSSSFLRGFDSSRFRDDKLLALAAEYRLGLHKNLDLALIYEAGKVFPTMGELSLNRLSHGYGVGFRLKSPRRVRLRLDFLRSPERTRIDLKLGPSF